MSVMTRIAMDWARRCFGAEHVSNPRIRGLRMVEEAIELCQALDVPKDKVLMAVETVYSRPVGDAEQEIGGVLMTVAVLCESLGLEQEGLMERELTRVLAKSPEHFAQRNQEKLDLGLDAAKHDFCVACGREKPLWGNCFRPPNDCPKRVLPC